MKRIKLFFLIILPIAASFLFPSGGQAKLSYDPYSKEPRYPESQDIEALKKQDQIRSILNLPSLPFRGLSYGTEKILNWAERTYLKRKIKWFWEDVLHENGIFPETRFSPRAFGIGAGSTIRFEKLLNLEERFPFLRLHGTGGATFRGDADVGASYELFQSSGWRLYHKGIFDFTHKENENFYGLGPRTSRGDGYSYEINTTLLEASAGFRPLKTVDVGTSFIYRHVTINNGDVRGAGNFENFSIGELPGVDGGQIITLKSFIEHDTRDVPDDPKSGGLQRFTLDFNRDMRHNDNYFKYHLELSQYFKLWSERRILALHFTGEHTKTVNHSSIPFFDMARLGGYGTQPRGSTTLRGYKYNRFFDKSSAVLNAEYRYNVWQYGNIGADWIFFTDIGKVFGDLHEFGIGGMRVSYGTGIRIKTERRVILSFQLAKSNEGTEFYVRTKTPF